MAKIDLEKIENKAKKEIDQVENSRELNLVFNKYFGKKGEINSILSLFNNLSKAEKAETGRKINQLKKSLRASFDFKAEQLKKTVEQEKVNKQSIDVTAPGKKVFSGHLHPLTLTRRKAQQIFKSIGFSIADGPDIETDWYNFDALNIPKDHPARDLWDTFYLKNKMLLRTHTSPVQVRYLEKNNPPLRVIVPGNVFRHEATDASHEFQLYQMEGLMVDKNISVANLKHVIGQFFAEFFDQEVVFRLNPDFFPFTEPSFNIVIKCLVCQGKKCPACKKSGWMEVAGAGMVHPNVFKNAGLKSGDWQGWAFGFGLERLAMLKYKINDIRLFRSNDLRFLKQF
jgi:phenylalanyl-tRNA synthetase alpha chain